MAIDSAGDWDGTCACGKAAMDGVRCALGATHKPRAAKVQKSVLIMPWETPTKTEFPWQTK